MTENPSKWGAPLQNASLDNLELSQSSIHYNSSITGATRCGHNGRNPALRFTSKAIPQDFLAFGHEKQEEAQLQGWAGKGKIEKCGKQRQQPLRGPIELGEKTSLQRERR
ncbi:hypothetical protein Y032_0023g699 [Ancylostoma ceylanicum]|uniref:Uncharacterized protein n=1 Tax=Ancylostoma ceylanicum TaxID=53326 RepID=A0A016UX29_9BILA|nr:hypothetical protein Y032_0023g699 [Ancylostoma ceylanicum]